MTISSVFLNLVNISITASWLTLAIVIFRLVFKKAPKYITCALWALVAIRLIFPISIESPFSLIPSEETIPLEIEFTKTPTVDTGFNSLDTALNPVIQENFAPTSELTSMNPIQLPIWIGAYIWQIGVFAMLLYALVSYLRIRFKVRERVKIDKNIYICDRIPSPFILGLIRPKIYLPSHLNEEESQFVISHEKAHIKRLDFIWKPLGYILLTIYWFNPVMWLGYILLCRDIEYACDEKVVKELDLTEKKSYSETLLNLSIHRPYITACPLAFGESGVKSRIKSVLNYKKPAFWVIIVSIILCMAVAVCFMTNPMGKSFKSDTATPFATYHNGRMYFIDISKIYSCDKNFENVEFLTEGFALFPCVLDNTLYFVGESYEHTGSIEAINLKTNEHKEIYVSKDGGVSINYLAPLGGNLLFNENGNLTIIDTDGNVLSETYIPNATGAYSNEEYLLYTDNSSLTELHKYNFKTKEDTLLLSLDDSIFGSRFYPDGKYIYFTIDKEDVLSLCRLDTKQGKTEVLLEEGFGSSFVIDNDMCYFIKGTHQSDDENLYAFNIKSRKLTALPCPAAQYATGLQLFGDYLVVNTHYFVEPDLAVLNLRDNSFKWIGQDFYDEAPKEPIVPQYRKYEVIGNTYYAHSPLDSYTPLPFVNFIDGNTCYLSYSPLASSAFGGNYRIIKDELIIEIDEDTYIFDLTENDFVFNMEKSTIHNYEFFPDGTVFSKSDESPYLDIDKNSHHITEYKDGMKDDTLKEYYKEDISDVMTLTEAKFITIKYFDYDFNYDDLTDKFVIIASPLHSGTAGDSIDILINNGDGTYKDICTTHLRLPENPDIFVVPQKENYPSITIITDEVYTFTFNGKEYTIPSKAMEDKLYNIVIFAENKVEKIINEEPINFLTGEETVVDNLSAFRFKNLTFSSICEEVEEYSHGNATDIFIRKNGCRVDESGHICMLLSDGEMTFGEYDRNDFTLLTEGDLSTALFKRYNDKSDPTTCREFLYLFTPNSSGEHIVNDILVQENGEWVRVSGVW